MARLWGATWQRGYSIAAAAGRGGSANTQGGTQKVKRFWNEVRLQGCARV
jgi:hypothetical protein